MKQPKLSDLTIDTAGTRKIRAGMKKSPSVKITINIDAESLDTLRDEAARTGIPYQRLLNNILKEGLARQSETEDRLDRIEKELARIKKQLVA